jgi:lipoic acid synthetase
LAAGTLTRLLRVRWLGRVRYQEAHALQRAIRSRPGQSYLLALEHESIYTYGPNARPENLPTDPSSLGAKVQLVDRGGDVTWHGPGQLVGYLLLDVEMAPGAVAGHVARIEQLVIAMLGELGLPGATRRPGFPGVWLGADTGQWRKICAIGTRIARGRSMHGFALNVNPDLEMFSRIVPCGITDAGVTSLAEEDVAAPMEEVVAVMAEVAAGELGFDSIEFQQVDTLARIGSLVPSRAVPMERKPAWLRSPARMGPNFVDLSAELARSGVNTVCQEAGCPNIFECFGAGTATFMIAGTRCTRACHFCLVDTGRPSGLDPGEPEAVAETARRMGLSHVVVTAVARDDLADGGAGHFAATIRALHEAQPLTTVEVLIPDFKGSRSALAAVLEARPDVVNHNLETVARLQRAVRPSAGYARSLAVLARARAGGFVTKSGLMVGLGETEAELEGAMNDLLSVGVEILTVGQYLRPSRQHRPVSRFYEPEWFEDLARRGRRMGFTHVEASPLTRSSYHARAAFDQTIAPSSAGPERPVRLHPLR